MSEAVKDIESEVTNAHDAAFKSAKGGDEKWNQVLESYSIKPLSDKEKEFLLNSDMKIATGAFPIELRRVLQAIHRKHSVLSMQSQTIQDFLRNFNIDAEIMRYHQKIKPFGGMSDIFKNAKTTSTKYSKGIQGAKTSTHSCKNCGAPRLEEMQYEECLFCGSELFEPIKES